MTEINKEIFENTDVLVTGGAGFIGSNLVRRLLEYGANVSIIEDFATGNRSNIEDVEDDVRLIQSDVSLISSPLPGFEDASYIFHLAAIPSVPRSVRDPTTTNRANVTGSLRLLEMAREIEPEVIVNAGSSAVYGETDELPMTEDAGWNPVSPYAASKAAMELYAEAYHETFELPVITLRLFNVFGPYQDPDSEYAAVVPSFISSLLRRERPVIYGDGKQTRDFTYVSNVVDAFLSAAQRPENAGEVYNISGFRSTSINELFEVLRDISGLDVDPVYEDPRPGDIRHSYADISRAREELDYEPVMELKEGLLQTWEWFEEHL